MLNLLLEVYKDSNVYLSPYRVRVKIRKQPLWSLCPGIREKGIFLLSKIPMPLLHFHFQVLNFQLTWTCRKMPWLNSSKYFTCQTRKDPSAGWMVNSMSGLLFHSMVRVSIFLSSSIEGRGMLELDPGEDALVLPCSPGSPSSPCSEDALSDISSRSRKAENNPFIKQPFYKMMLLIS